MIANWHDLEPTREAEGPIEYDGWDLGTAAGTVEIGVTRARILPRRQSSPVHVEVAEEEIFYVLDGSGLSWQDGKTYDVRRGDAIVHVAGAEAHTFVALAGESRIVFDQDLAYVEEESAKHRRKAAVYDD